ncbi:MAG: hypothetical protein C0483_05425 [Pirellula sp.]|nr:hypothetical protein [Pirellula sp.]
MSDRSPSIDKPALRGAVRLSYVAAVLWAAGNVLSSGLLLVYLARALGATGLQVSLLQAAPALVGLLRLFTPALILKFGTAKRVCLLTSVVAYALLALVPIVVGFGGKASLGALLWLLCVHQLLEQMATVALWTWLGDLVPRRLRGRYFGRRNILQLCVLIPLLPASGWAVDALKRHFPEQPGVPYVLAVAIGTALLLLSLVPLVSMPAGDSGTTKSPLGNVRNLADLLLQPLFDKASRRLLLFGCWFSFFNGLFSTAQNIFPKAVLGLELGAMNLMQATMRLGQIGVSAAAGPISDRRGNRPVLVACQLLVGTAPLFYFVASPEQPYWLYGAWILWSAYAGINICLPNLTMRLAPPGRHAANLAAYYALTSVFLTAGTFLGGYLFDLYPKQTWDVLGWSLDRYTLAFLLAWITRSAGAGIVATVPEPGVGRHVTLAKGDKGSGARE